MPIEHIAYLYYFLSYTYSLISIKILKQNLKLKKYKLLKLKKYCNKYVKQIQCYWYVKDKSNLNLGTEFCA